MSKIAAGSIIAVSILLAACKGGGGSGPEAITEQGWTRAEKLLWYHGNQGSRLIPKAWLVALEDAGSTDRFFTLQRMQAFGYLPPDPDDTSGMPIGFSEDRSDDSKFKRTQLHWFTGQGNTEPWVGMTCAACHTGEITVGGHGQRVEGGPGMADFQTFIERLDRAIDATLADPAKFQRFATAVLGADKVAADGDKLRGELAKLADWEHRIEQSNDPAMPGRTTVRYGYGRLDAVGHILNKVAVQADFDSPAGTPPQFTAAADAPVSYPFIWNIQQHDRVQWNGMAPNKGLKLPSGQIFDIGALGRNTGEVVGVFADVVMRSKPGVGGFESSVNVRNLDAMEVLIAKLEPPRWPVAFGVPAPAQVAAGKALYAAHCQECHAVLEPIAVPGGGTRPDLKTPIKAVMTPIFGPGGLGTDPWMACNAYTFRARTDVLEGTPETIIVGDPLPPIADTRIMLTTTVSGSLAGKKAAIAGTFARALFGLPRKIQETAGFAAPEVAQKSPAQRLQICMNNASDPLMAYKGRPLTGIWATAPYLHNGSVASLHELLLPPAQRVTSFPVGTRVMDPVKVGYVAGATPAPGIFSVNDSSGKPIPGNSNAGHDYGNANFTPAERQALIDFMKTL